MTVILSRKDWQHPKGNPACSFCGDEYVHPPFVLWRTCGDELIICAKCCSELRRGLVVDMTHVIAIRDVQSCG
jgi:hypothetical protein